MKRQFDCAHAAMLFLVGVLVTVAPAYAQSPSAAGEGSTPRLSNGTPDLSGVWNDVIARDGYGMPTKNSPYKWDMRVGIDENSFKGAQEGATGVVVPTRRPAPNQFEGERANLSVNVREATNQFNDFEYTLRLDPNRPLYKPEFWTKVQDLDYDTNFSDPIVVEACYPTGVPRLGPPKKIIQTANEVILFYASSLRSGPSNVFRIIPTDGRAHDPQAVPTYVGDAVGHWEGDTLVIDVRSFNDRQWLSGGLRGGGGGYLHSYEMRVIERLRRDGDMLYYQATVEDPEVLLEPWTMNEVQMRLDRNPKATIAEANPCDNSHDKATIVDRVRH